VQSIGTDSPLQELQQLYGSKLWYRLLIVFTAFKHELCWHINDVNKQCNHLLLSADSSAMGVTKLPLQLVVLLLPLFGIYWTLWAQLSVWRLCSDVSKHVFSKKCVRNCTLCLKHAATELKVLPVLVVAVMNCTTTRWSMCNVHNGCATFASASQCARLVSRAHSNYVVANTQNTTAIDKCA
jgi:hypothetical protein